MSGWKSLILLFFLGSATTPAAASRPGKDHALFFAVQDYTGTGLNNLKNPIRDAHTIAKELKEMYGFETAAVYENQTKSQIYAILEQWQKKTFPDDGQLFIFFSGHGSFWDFAKKGYFIPKGARSGDYDSYLELTTLGNIISAIPCRHILLAIDACYSGTIDEEIAFKGKPAFDRPTDSRESERRNLIDRQLRNPSRLLITSGGKERTPDGTDHSPFTTAILTTLRRAYTDSGDGMVTFSDLLAGLERVNPTPHEGVLPGHQDGGFVFIAEGFSPPQSSATDFSGEQPVGREFMTDQKGNRYPVVRLAGKQWLGKNLNLDIPGSWCYDNLPANCDQYGRLYTWEAAKNGCAALGAGWRLPTDEDWWALYDSFTMPGEPESGKSAYKALIKGGSSGFDALLAGDRSSKGRFFDLGMHGGFWSSTEPSVGNAWNYLFVSVGQTVNRDNSDKRLAYSVRCLKDD